MLLTPFDVRSEDIARLNDDQLRHVLRLLIEAEAKRHGIPLSAIRLGGHQNAPDRGVDARIEWNGLVDRTDWFPCRLVYFQSKAENMARSKLIRELAPKGTPRIIFSDLASASGAYIVFCTDDCSETMYLDRLASMREAVANIPHVDQIIFDFYDASRIARWVNSLSGVSTQVRGMIGRPMVGWRPFENWSASDLDPKNEYIVDERPKVIVGALSNEPILISQFAHGLLMPLANSTRRLRGISNKSGFAMNDSSNLQLSSFRDRNEI